MARGGKRIGAGRPKGRPEKATVAGTKQTPRRGVKALSALQQRFVAEYLKDLNGAAAVRRAGFDVTAPEQHAYKLLRLPHIKAAVARAEAARLKDAELTATRILEEVRRVALNDMRTFYDAAGNMKPISEWTADQGAVVAGFEVIKKNAEAGDGKIDTIHKWKVYDKLKALELAMKHLGLLEPEGDKAAAAVPCFIMPPGTKIKIK